MTVQPEQIQKADAARTPGGDRRLWNVPVVAQATDATDISFYQACALFEQESRGRNLYGGDKGPEPGPKDDGTFSGFKDEVNEANYRAFYHEVVVRGRTSNGVGPGQLTYRGFHEDMHDKGLKCSDLRQNMDYSCALWWGYFQDQRNERPRWSVASSIKRAGCLYNTGRILTNWATFDYVVSFYRRTQEWRKLVGVADTGIP